MFAACIANNNKKRRMNKKVNHLGIDVGKRKYRATIKDDARKILNEFFFGNDKQGIQDLISKVPSKEICATHAALESTGKHLDENP